MAGAVIEILRTGDDGIAIGPDAVVSKDTILETPLPAIDSVAAAVNNNKAHPTAFRPI